LKTPRIPCPFLDTAVGVNGAVAAGVMGDLVGVLVAGRAGAKAVPMLLTRLEVAESGVTVGEVASRARAE
jgi:hypothetical protein